MKSNQIWFDWILFFIFININWFKYFYGAIKRISLMNAKWTSSTMTHHEVTLRRRKLMRQDYENRSGTTELKVIKHCNRFNNFKIMIIRIFVLYSYFFILCHIFFCNISYLKYYINFDTYFFILFNFDIFIYLCCIFMIVCVK